MSCTTTSAQQAQSLEHRVAKDLHELADLIAAGHVPEQERPSTPWTLIHHATSALEVQDFAERMGVRTYRRPTDHGVHTTADLMLGEGTVLLHMVHIAAKPVTA
jgi:hypothetical protein